MELRRKYRLHSSTHSDPKELDLNCAWSLSGYIASLDGPFASSDDFTPSEGYVCHTKRLSHTFLKRRDDVKRHSLY